MKINVTAIAEEAKAAALLLPWNLVLTIASFEFPTRCPNLATVAAIEQAQSAEQLRTAVRGCFDTSLQIPVITDDELPIVAGAIMAELAKKKQQAVAQVMRKHLSPSGN